MVNAEAVESRAVESFRAKVQRISRSEPFDDLRESPELCRRVDSEVSRFARAVHHRLQELAGDGFLTLDEVQRALESLRSRHVDEMKENLLALSDGASPPPRRSENESWLEFSMRQMRYAIVERNEPTKLLWLLAAFGAAVGLVAGLSFSLKAVGKRAARGGTVRSLARLTRAPVYLFALLGAVEIWLSTVWLPIELRYLLRKTVLLLAGMIALWVLWRLSSAISVGVASGRFDTHGRELVQSGVRLFWLALFVVYVVEVIVGTDFTALFTGLGVASIALTLAARDSLRNLFATGTVHADSLFRVGDLVRYREHFGTIEQIGFRSVKLRTLDGHLVTIPNAKITEEAVENVGARPFIRRRFDLSLVYRTPPEKMQRAIEIVRDVLQSAEFVLDDPEVRVAFHEFSTYSLDMMVLYYHRETDWWVAKEKDTELNLEILQRFADEGIEFAFPTRTLHSPGAAVPQSA